MTLRSTRPGSSGGGMRRTLADVLYAGPMALSAALRCATELAGALRELHERNRAHGTVAASNVWMTANGAELAPSQHDRAQGDTARDVRDFGALLFEMLTGARPTVTDVTSTPKPAVGSRTSAAGLRAAAVQVATGCFAEGTLQPTIQQVATELRLLAVLLRMEEARGGTPTPAVQAPAPVPFLVAPSQMQVVRPAPQAHPTTDPNASDAGSRMVPLGLGSFGQPTPKPNADVEPRGGTCPKCDSSVVYVSRARSRFEHYLVRIKVPICRCHRCYHRYFVFANLKVPKEMPVGTARKRRPHKRHT